MLSPTRDAEALTVSRARCAYRAVVWTWVCPRSFPIIGRLSPSSTAREAKECRLFRNWNKRHSYASGGLLVGEGLPMIGKLLGHNHVHTTARYAHLANDPLKSAANRIALRIAEVAG